MPARLQTLANANTNTVCGRYSTCQTLKPANSCATCNICKKQLTANNE